MRSLPASRVVEGISSVFPPCWHILQPKWLQQTSQKSGTCSDRRNNQKNRLKSQGIPKCENSLSLDTTSTHIIGPFWKIKKEERLLDKILEGEEAADIQSEGGEAPIDPSRRSQVTDIWVREGTETGIDTRLGVALQLWLVQVWEDEDTGYGCPVDTEFSELDAELPDEITITLILWCNLRHTPYHTTASSSGRHQL